MKYIFYLLIFVIILFISSCKESTTDSGGNQTANFTQIDYEPSFSANGNKILYIHSNIDFEFTGIKLKDLITGSDSLLINSNARSPALSPDSKNISYSINNFLVKAKFNGDSQQTLKSSGINLYPKWDFNGSRILFADVEKNSSGNGVWLINSDGSGSQLLESNASFPFWINDSRIVFFKIIFDSNGNESGDTIIERNIDGTDRSIIRVLQGNDHVRNSFLNYHNGEYIFCSTSSAGYSYIYKRNSSGEVIRLTETQGWSPAVNRSDGRIIYTNRNPGNGRLWEMDINGNGKKQITF